MFSEVGVLVFSIFIGASEAHNKLSMYFLTLPPFHFLVTAEDCGIRRNDCPRMCNDEAIAHLYCDTLCFPINKAMYRAYCREPFLSSNSTTYKRLKGTWKERLQCCEDPLYGRFASDIFQFGEYSKTPKLELEFVEGTLLQRRALRPYSGLIGLGFQDSSGHVGLVEQLYQRKIIKEPIISFSSSLVVLGTLDSQHCDSWSHFPVVSDALGWTFEVERVELFGMSISSQNYHFEVPKDVKQKLIELGILTDCYLSISWWCVRDDTERTFAIHGSDYVYSLYILKSYECHQYDNQSICITPTKDVEYPRSNGRNSWVVPLNHVWIMKSGLLALDLLA
ncbi:hypothetical protein M3Y98_01165100 [Aphelenchoides besseyi]|nr:hypothetical protein M3Y98_01165100 [Aphelenchoides besseyi]